ncbi:pancreatic lipase-related protein 2 [Amyelois transitella]|uniref:pancreatic lipase-related protein 2 n=1 Tax=Amyelois transitella TaxID=680683 RepID=UPI00298F69C3|nr:pancreatic lipase-related protein 2 [Amyelois transitella]
MKSLSVAVVFLGFVCAISAESKYNADVDTQYHLFTRRNPTVSQPLLNGNADILVASNYDPRLRTVVSIHGWNGFAFDDYNSVVAPAILASDDVNLIIVDWHQGSLLGLDALLESGLSVARFISWLKFFTGRAAEDFHLVGFSLGAHHAGITGRNVEGGVSYITALDPAGISFTNDTRIHPDDGLYTEAIFTNAGELAHLGNLAQVNFYPNGGRHMPGCNFDPLCNHFRAYFYFAESIVSGGFTGTECEDHQQAVAESCDLPARLQMGARLPNYGATGTYHLKTNAGPPFSID